MLKARAAGGRKRRMLADAAATAKRGRHMMISEMIVLISKQKGKKR